MDSFVERGRYIYAFEEATEGEEVARVEKLKSKWAQLEAVVGSGGRIKLVARDLVDHFEKRLEAMDGKAMIATMSRRIAVALYNEIIALRPEWHGEDDAEGALKIVMTGSGSDPLEWQAHIRSKACRETLADRFRDAGDHFKIVIVRDMWLTGFDVPTFNTCRHLISATIIGRSDAKPWAYGVRLLVLQHSLCGRGGHSCKFVGLPTS